MDAFVAMTTATTLHATLHQDLPRFTDVLPEQVVPELEKRLNANRERLKTLLAATTDYRWDNLVTPLEAAEKIECLRYLEYGIPLKMVVTDYMGVNIDTPEDMEKARLLV